VIRGQVGREPGGGAGNVQMPKPPKKRPSSVNISQTTSAQQIPPRKAHRSFPIRFASCAIFWNAAILLNPSIAKEILKSQSSNAPSVASCGWSPFIKLPNGGRIPLNTAMKKARWRPDRDNIAASGSRAMKAVSQRISELSKSVRRFAEGNWNISSRPMLDVETLIYALL